MPWETEFRRSGSRRRLSLEPLEERHLLAVRFAVIGDWGSDSVNATRVADMIQHPSWDVDFVVTTGDNNYGQIDTGHTDWEARVGARFGAFIQGRADNRYPSQTSATQRFFPVVGNHDGTATGTGQTGASGGIIPGYIDYFVTDPGNPPRLGPGGGQHSIQQSYYDVRWENIHLFATDSDHTRVSSNSRAGQQQWLATNMPASDATWKFVMTHHPPHSSSSVHGSDPVMRWDYAAWQADAVFSGHDHTYERILGPEDDLPYFVSGLGGRSLYPLGNPVPGSQVRYNDDYGAMRVTVDGTVATFEFLSLDDGAQGANGGRVIDTYTIDKTPGGTPPTVASVQRNDGARFPDRLTSVRFAFDQDVSASLDSDDLTIRNLRTSAVVPLTNTVFTANNARWNLAGEDLAPGYYELTLAAEGIHNADGVHLDGDADGIAGDNWRTEMLVAVPGDANLDGAVDGQDWHVWLTHHDMTPNATWEQADFNYSRTVDQADLTLWSTHRFQTVRPTHTTTRTPRQAAFHSTAVHSTTFHSTAAALPWRWGSQPHGLGRQAPATSRAILPQLPSLNDLAFPSGFPPQNAFPVRCATVGPRNSVPFSRMGPLPEMANGAGEDLSDESGTAVVAKPRWRSLEQAPTTLHRWHVDRAFADWAHDRVDEPPGKA